MEDKEKENFFKQLYQKSFPVVVQLNYAFKLYGETRNGFI